MPAAATTAAVPEVSFLHRPCFVNSKRTSGDFRSIELRDCFLRSGFVRHLHIGETFRASGIAICDDLGRFNLADRAEHIAKVSFCGLERKVSNELFLPLQQYMLQIQIHESEPPQLCSVDFRFGRMTPKGSLPRRQRPLFLLLLKRVKAMLGMGRFSPIHSWTVSSWLSNTSKKNPYVCRLGLEPVKKG